MKRSVLLLAVGLAAAAVIGLAGLNPHLPGGGDNAEYIAQAEALQQVGHRANLHLLGDPEDTFRPPLYPYLLSVLTRFFGRNVALFKAFNVLFALGAIAAAWWFLLAALGSDEYVRLSSLTGRESSGGDEAPNASVAAGWVALWFALTPLLLYCAHDVLSDVPFACLVLCALGCAVRAERPRGIWWVVGALALLVVAMLLRTAAVFVAGALAGYFAIEWVLRLRRSGSRRFLAVGLVFAVLAAGLLFWSSRGSQTYLSQLRSSGSSSVAAVAGRMQQWGFLYGVSLIGEVAAHDATWPYLPCPPLPKSLCEQWGLWSHGPGLVLVWVAAGWGCVVLWRRRCRMIPVVFLLYMGALLLWPFFDARFYLPVLPLFLALVWCGARAIVETALRYGTGVGLGVVFFLALMPAACLLGALLAWGDLSPTFQTELEWVAGGVLLAGVLLWLVGRVGGPLGGRLAVLLAVVVLALAGVRAIGHNLIRERRWGPALFVEGWPEFYTAAKMIEKSAASGDVVVSGKTSLVWFWTDLKGIPVPATTDVTGGLKAIEGANWAMVDSLPDDRAAARYLLPLLRSDREHWQVWGQVPMPNEQGEAPGVTIIWKRRRPSNP